MIPKKIHYCWFGRNPLPELAVRCIESWKKYCPDYEIIEWNEDNYDINKISYVKEAYQARKWAFVTDYVRLDVVNQYGGIYLDTDVELLKSLDPLLKYKSFFGMEEGKFIATGLGFGAEKGTKILKEMLNQYKGRHYCVKSNIYNFIGCPYYNTIAAFQFGFRMDIDEIQYLSECCIFPPEYFAPMNFNGEMNITSNTYSIHHYAASWKEKEKKNKLGKIYDDYQKSGISNFAEYFFFKIKQKIEIKKVLKKYEEEKQRYQGG